MDNFYSKRVYFKNIKIKQETDRMPRLSCCGSGMKCVKIKALPVRPNSLDIRFMEKTDETVSKSHHCRERLHSHLNPDEPGQNWLTRSYLCFRTFWENVFIIQKNPETISVLLLLQFFSNPNLIWTELQF